MLSEIHKLLVSSAVTINSRTEAGFTVPLSSNLQVLSRMTYYSVGFMLGLFLLSGFLSYKVAIIMLVVEGVFLLTFMAIKDGIRKASPSEMGWVQPHIRKHFWLLLFSGGYLFLLLGNS